MLAAIAEARHHVHLDTYILHEDATGRRFQEALVECARHGCRVRLIYDSLGSFTLPASYLNVLTGAGIEVIEFHPVAPWRARWSWNKRDHQKMLIVDDRVAFTGGLNIGDENMPVEEGGGGWFDWHAEIEGPAVFDIADAFRRTWIQAGGEPFDEPSMPGPFAGRSVLGVQVISNIKLKNRWRMNRAYLWAIRRAQREISIMNAYFIPEFDLRHAFRRAVDRGVVVRVIVPSVSDVPAVFHASRHLYRRLIERGVRIFEWPEQMMHAKFGVIDGVWSTIGTYNLDRRSLHHNLEVGLVVIDEELGGRLAEEFARDVARCREVTLAELDALSTWQRAFGWFCYQFRYWM